MIEFPLITVGVSPRIPGTAVPHGKLVELYAAGYNLVKVASDTPNEAKKRTWFGVAGQTSSAAIDASSRKMLAHMNGGIKKLHFNCTNTEGSMLSFNQYARLKVPGGPPADQLYKQSQVNVNAGFLDQRYSFGERVGSILHEITHMCIGTDDVTYDGREMYGADYCAELAQAAPDLALRNAENWCYYFTSYHAQIAQSGFDWSGLTPQEVAARRAR